MPQILFLDRVMDIPVDARGWYTQCKLCRTPWNPAVVDVLVIMRLKFQQLLVHERDVVRVQPFSLWNRNWYLQCKRAEFRGDSTGAVRWLTSLCSCSDKLVAPQTQFFDRLVDIPVAQQRPVSTVQLCREPWKLCSFMFINKVFDVLVFFDGQFQQFKSFVQ